MQNFSIEVLKNDLKKDNYSFETNYSQYENPSVLIHGPKRLLGSYSINNGSKSSKSSFPIRIHSVNPGNHILKLDVYNLQDKEVEFSMNFPLTIEKQNDNRLSLVKILSLVSITAVLMFTVFTAAKVTNMRSIKNVFDTLRSPTSLFSKKLLN